MNLTSWLYKAARLSATARAIGKTVQTGNPKYMARRAKNLALGRLLARAGFWRFLFGGGKR